MGRGYALTNVIVTAAHCLQGVEDPTKLRVPSLTGVLLDSDNKAILGHVYALTNDIVTAAHCLEGVEDPTKLRVTLTKHALDYIKLLVLVLIVIAIGSLMKGNYEGPTENFDNDNKDILGRGYALTW